MTSHQLSFLDRGVARILSLVLSILIVVMLVMLWGQELKATFITGQSVYTLPQKSSPAAGNPALDTCLNRRIGDVNKMRSDGVIDDRQYEQFTSRAISLCEMQNQ